MARISGSKFAVIVTDAKKRKLRIAFDLRKAAPKAPDKVKARENHGEVEVVWLAAQQNGAWRFANDATSATSSNIPSVGT